MRQQGNALRGAEAWQLSCRQKRRALGQRFGIAGLCATSGSSGADPHLRQVQSKRRGTLPLASSQSATSKERDQQSHCLSRAHLRQAKVHQVELVGARRAGLAQQKVLRLDVAVHVAAEESRNSG